MFKDIFPFLDSLSNNWQKPRGIIAVSLFLLILYYSFFLTIAEKVLPGKNLLTTLIVPLFFIVLLVILWLISTRRIGWIKNSKTVIGLLVEVDENESEAKIKKLIEKTVKEINSEYNKIKLRFFPVNYLGSEQKLDSFLKKKRHVLDSLIHANVRSGNFTYENGKVDSIILVERIKYVGNFDLNKNFKLLKTTINGLEDIRVRASNKNWSYIEGNSLIDKLKISSNFKDTILFFSGIYLVYKNDYENALEVLKTLRNLKASELTITNDNQAVAESKDFLAAARLNSILLNLYTLFAIRSYIDENNREKAFKALKECEAIFGKNHPGTYHQAIPLARYYFERGELEKAKEYTAIAKNLKPDGVEIYLNEGFFGILDNDENKVAKNYKELGYTYKYKKLKGYYFVEIVAFLNKEKPKYPQSAVLFDFAMAVLNYFYVDQSLGKKELLRLKEEINSGPILILISRFIEKGSFKSNYQRRKPKKKKIQKKKQARKALNN